MRAEIEIILKKITDMNVVTEIMFNEGMYINLIYFFNDNSKYFLYNTNYWRIPRDILEKSKDVFNKALFYFINHTSTSNEYKSLYKYIKDYYSLYGMDDTIEIVNRLTSDNLHRYNLNKILREALTKCLNI